MKVVLISDTHNREIDLPEGDVLIIAGDLTKNGTKSQISMFNDWIAGHSHKYKHKPVAVAGNHDFMFETDRSRAESLLTSCVYLEDQMLVLDGKKIYGSPWTPTFFNWAFMKDRGEQIRHYWDLIPDGLDLLITHGPPWGILDDVGRHAKQHVGCEELLRVLTEELKSPPRFHAFGHIHEGHGCHITDKTWYYNVSVCDEEYQPTNPATVIEI